MNINNQTERYSKWQLLIKEQEKSGLSQSEFCKKHDVVLSQFTYYRSILKVKEIQKKPPQLFTAVEIKKSETNLSAEIKIILPNGFQCFIPRSMDASYLKRLMEALLSC